MAQRNAGNIYCFGLLGKKDYESAIFWYQKAAEQDEPYALYHLGCCYEDGTGVCQDLSIALAFHEKAAELGNEDARQHVQRLKAAHVERKKTADELVDEGVTYHQAGDYQKAAGLFETAATLGSTVAMYNLGLYYENGWGVPQDAARSFRYFLKSADLGYADAQYRAGQGYCLGKGVETNAQEGRKYMELAAGQAIANAQNWMGIFYLEGTVVNQDLQKAVYWFRQAAKQNDLYAFWNLGRCYANGWGVTKDKAAALSYYEKAAALGHLDARNEVERLKTELAQMPVNQEKLPVEDSAMQELQALIGLDAVKNEIKTLYNLCRVLQQRKARGFQVKPTSLNMVFTGNPGTGKTTVARMFGKLLKEIGLLSKGHVVAVERKDLVSEHIGGTAPQTQKVIDEAMGGVLFIDEVYTLVQAATSNDYGQEAIDTLLTALEENRENLVVIVAGYDGEMRRFIKSNDGLSSRFTKYIHFDDYDAQALEEIFYSMTAGKGYRVEEDAREELRRVCQEMHAQKTKGFGNAREIRNMCDAVKASIATRTRSMTVKTKELLTTVIREDIVFADMKRKEMRELLDW